MISFLKSFFANEKSVEEQALMAGQKQRDILTLDGYVAEEEEQPQGCGTKTNSGCGGCGCR